MRTRLRPVLLLILLLSCMSLAWSSGGGFDSILLSNLPSGAVIGWNSNDVTLTHSSDRLTVAGGTLVGKAGAGGTPGFALATTPTLGFWQSGVGEWNWGTSGVPYFGLSIAQNADASYGSVTIGYRGALIFGPTTPASGDTFLKSEAAAILQVGLDAAAPVGQTFKGPDPRAGTDANTAGGNLTIAPGRSTGTARAGTLSLQQADTGAAGSTHNALRERFRLQGGPTVLADNTATTVATVVVPNSTACMVVLTFSATAADATNTQGRTGIVAWSSVATNAGAVTSVAEEETTAVAVSAGTLTQTWATTTGANAANLRLTLDSSLDVTSAVHFNIIHTNGCAITFP